MALMENSGYLGLKMPSFELIDVYGKKTNSVDLNKKANLVIFICAHCPYVKAIEQRLISLYKLLDNQSFTMVGICSNDPTDYPEDSASNLRIRVSELQIPFAYLIDETQQVAKAFGAVCTPDIFLFDENQSLVYHGRLDDNWKDARAVTQEDLKNAIQALINDVAIPTEQFPTMGCSIKWKT